MTIAFQLWHFYIKVFIFKITSKEEVAAFNKLWNNWPTRLFIRYIKNYAHIYLSKMYPCACLLDGTPNNLIWTPGHLKPISHTHSKEHFYFTERQ